jgi:hypothetical protein
MNEQCVNDVTQILPQPPRMNEVTKMSAIFAGLSLVITFCTMNSLFSEYIIANILIHIILGLSYGALCFHPSWFGILHIMYCLMLVLFGSMVFLNMSPTEFIKGKIGYSYESDEKIIQKDMIGRTIVLEKSGLIQNTKQFKLLDGVSRIDIYGENDYRNILGYIILGGATRLYEKNFIEGQCGPSAYIHPKESSWPECKEECKKNSMCNHIKWDTSNKCYMMSACSQVRKSSNWRHMSFEKMPTNILKHTTRSTMYFLSKGNYLISEDASHVLLLNDKGKLKLYKNPNGNKKTGIIKLNLKDSNSVTKNNYRDLFDGLMIYGNGILQGLVNSNPVWMTKENEGKQTNLILLNRGLLVLFQVETNKIIWTHSETWKNDEDIEDIEEEIIKESEKTPKYKYNIRKHQIIKIEDVVEHQGTITLLEDNNKKIKGRIKLITSDINNENYMIIKNASKYDGKYLIR